MIQEIWKNIIKGKSNKIIDQEFKDKVQETYKMKKIELIDQFTEIKIQENPNFMDKLMSKYMPQIKNTESLPKISKIL